MPEYDGFHKIFAHSKHGCSECEKTFHEIKIENKLIKSQNIRTTRFLP